MDPLGIVTWLVVGLAIAAAVTAFLQARPGGDLVHDLMYVVPASLLGTFMGSEAFKANWRFVGSEKGPEIAGYFIVTSVVFGVFITVFAARAANTPAPQSQEDAR